MKVSYRWLKRYLNIDLTPDKVAELLTDTGLEVEGVEEVESIKGGLKGVIIGEVLTCEKHPGADKLSLTTVDLGHGEPVQIVCGAPNVAAGQKVPVATVGAVLYPNGEELKIKKGKIRGEVSMGMICAEDELGLGSNHDGIMVLDPALQAGTAASEVFQLESDFVFEIGLTPNRTDAMGHIGVARDLRAAMLTGGLEAPDLDIPKANLSPSTNNPIQLILEDTEGCPAYNGIYFSGAHVTESPEWLKNSLKALGITPKNNVVDITNYVLHTFGHPLHAFDADQIKDGKVVIRSAKEGEKLHALDDTVKELHPTDLIIADAHDPICLAGILGGKHSGVTSATQNIYLEGAYFHPVRIRKSAKRHGLSTDASYRYERGVDPNATKDAQAYAAQLICELTGATASPTDHQGEHQFPRTVVEFSFDKIMKLMGVQIDPSKVKEILNYLDFEILSAHEDLWSVKVPTYRVDVTRDVDIAEEILRIYGFNNVPVPSTMRISVAPLDARPEKVEKSTLSQLTGNGFYEIMNNSLSKKEHYEVLQPDTISSLVEMLNPLSLDLNVMRGNLLYGGLESISFNQKRQNPNLRFFERGKSYGKSSNGYFENQHLDLFITGLENDQHWSIDAHSNDLFELKGIVEALINRFNINVQYTPSQHSQYGEVLEIKAGKLKLGNLGSVHPKVLKYFDIKGKVMHASLNWDIFMKLILQKGTELFQPLPKYPSVRRDLALLVQSDTTFEQIKEVVARTERKLLKHFFLFDVYEGDKLPPGMKSYACGLIFQDDNKTLNDKAVEKSVQRITDQLSKNLGVALRA